MNQAFTDLFFDLDRTLIDFDTSSKETLLSLFRDFISEKDSLQQEFNRFFEVYSRINPVLWEQYRKKEISKEFLNQQRFSLSFREAGIECRDEASFAKQYVLRSAAHVRLFPETLPLLDYLRGNYRLHVITNGFQEVQEGKLSLSGLSSYFCCIITSEMAGFMKPDRRIFEHALQCAGAEPQTSLMIGDDLAVDIEGALAVGMSAAWLNPVGPLPPAPVLNIRSLSELKDWL